MISKSLKKIQIFSMCFICKRSFFSFTLFLIAFYVSYQIFPFLDLQHRFKQIQVLVQDNKKSYIQYNRYKSDFMDAIKKMNPHFLQIYKNESFSLNKKYIAEILETSMNLNRFFRAIPSINPLKGKAIITSFFGVRTDPKENIIAFHSGIDLFSSIGSPILATGNGIVDASMFDKEYGYTITLLHAYGFKSVYAHMTSLSPYSVGSFIKQGQVLGYVGSSGRSFGPHLHYEILYDPYYQNPIYYLFLLKSLSFY